MCAYNRTVDKVDKFLQNEAKGTKIVGAHSVKEMVNMLKLPRRVMLMVQAGKAVDDFIDQLVSLKRRSSRLDQDKTNPFCVLRSHCSRPATLSSTVATRLTRTRNAGASIWLRKVSTSSEPECLVARKEPDTDLPSCLEDPHKLGELWFVAWNSKKQC